MTEFPRNLSELRGVAVKSLMDAIKAAQEAGDYGAIAYLAKTLWKLADE